MPSRSVLVVFDTRYGNTWKVAEALAKGLGSVPGVAARCLRFDAVHAEDLEDTELLVIGGPTEFFTASAHVQELFDRIGGFNLHGKYGFAFDTHAKAPLAGSAARSIERHLTRAGVELIEPHHTGFTVSHLGAKGSPDAEHSVELAPGTEAEFERIGVAVAHHLLTLPVAADRTPAPTETL